MDESINCDVLFIDVFFRNNIFLLHVTLTNMYIVTSVHAKQVEDCKCPICLIISVHDQNKDKSTEILLPIFVSTVE